MTRRAASRAVVARADEFEALRIRAEEAEDVVRAIRQGEVDAIVTQGPEGEQVFTLRGAERPYRLMVEMMSEGAGSIRADGVVLYANHRLADMLGVRLEELIGASMLEFVAKDTRSSLLELIGDAGAGAARRPIELTTRDGSALSIYAAMAALHEPEGALVAVFTDVSELKRAEQELRDRRDRLEGLVAQRTEEIAKANAQLQAANGELEAFAYSVSHDLRAPLRAVDGFSEMVLEDYGPKLDDEGRRRLAVIRENAQRMGRMIDDILAISRAGRASLEIARHDMTGLVRAIWTELAPGLAGRRIELRLGDLPAAWGDGPMLRRVWQNLLDNAVKYTAPRDAGVVEVGGRTEGEETIYFVRDNGVGFDANFANKLFGAFQRLHGPEFPGTGVGLAIVKRIVARHGGRVWAEGAVGEGATFYFALPSQEASVVAAAETGLGDLPPAPAN